MLVTFIQLHFILSSSLMFLSSPFGKLHSLSPAFILHVVFSVTEAAHPSCLSLVCLSVCLSKLLFSSCLSVYQAVHSSCFSLPICMSIHPVFLFLIICLSILLFSSCLSVCPSILLFSSCLSICLSICPSIHPSIYTQTATLKKKMYTFPAVFTDTLHGTLLFSFP